MEKLSRKLKDLTVNHETIFDSFDIFFDLLMNLKIKESNIEISKKYCSRLKFLREKLGNDEDLKQIIYDLEKYFVKL